MDNSSSEIIERVLEILVGHEKNCEYPPIFSVTNTILFSYLKYLTIFRFSIIINVCLLIKTNAQSNYKFRLININYYACMYRNGFTNFVQKALSINILYMYLLYINTYFIKLNWFLMPYCVNSITFEIIALKKISVSMFQFVVVLV